MKEQYTRFERARIIGARALQIAKGAPITIETSSKSPIQIAEIEFEKGTIPIDVKRKAPSKLEVS